MSNRTEETGDCVVLILCAVAIVLYITGFIG